MDINIRDINGNTPIIKASRVGNKDLVSFFLKCGADPEIKNKEGENAIDLAKNDITKSLLVNFINKSEYDNINKNLATTNNLNIQII